MPWKDLGKVVGSNGTVGNVDSTYINNGGDPGVSITRSGDDTAPDITFNFENLVNDPLTESEIEQITNDVSVNSSHTANGTVLTSIWAGIKAKFAAKSHVHDASDITTGQLAAALIANGTITEEMLAAAAVSTGKIGAKAVTEAKLGDGAVATAKLADDAVTADKLADGSVGIAHLDEEMAAGWESLSQHPFDQRAPMRWSGNVDDAAESGTYLIVDPGDNAGLPTGVYRYGLLVVFGNTFDGGEYTAQLFIAHTGGQGGGCIYWRNRYGGNYNAWRRVTSTTL